MAEQDHIPLALTYQLRDAVTALHGRAQLLARHLDAPDATVARAREDAEKLRDCLALLDAIVAAHGGDRADPSDSSSA